LVVIAYGQKRIEDLSPHFHKGVIAGNLLIILYFSIGMVYLQFFGKLDSVSSNSIRIFDNLLQNYNHRTYVGLALVAGYLSFNSIFETTGIKNTYWLNLGHTIPTRCKIYHPSLFHDFSDPTIFSPEIQECYFHLFDPSILLHGSFFPSSQAISLHEKRVRIW
jgi:hypothetical protein